MASVSNLAQSTITTPVRPCKVALVCDFLEERWPSMDLFGDMLFQCFQNDPAAVYAEQLRAPFRARLSRWAASGLFWNADRLLNRFYDYPRWLHGRAAGFDLFHLVDHSYSQLILELPPASTVVTCHDLDTFRCLLEPELEPRPRWFRAMVRRILDGFLRAGHVICVSEFTKAQLLRHRLFRPDQVTVIHPGVDPAYFSAPEPDAGDLLEALPTDGPWLLHVGSTIPRKRIDVLLRVFARVLAAFPQMRLVRVGGEFTAGQSQLARSLGLEDRIVQMPRLTKTQLAVVYRNAALVLQPSEAEGFGLPVIEAMACGCPVLASDIASLREAGGSAAGYLPVADIDAWTEKVTELLHEREAAPESWELRRSSARRHAAGFTWAENAARTMAVYQRVLH